MKKATIIKRSIGLLTSVAMLVFMSFPVCAAPAVSEDVVVSTESNGGGTVSPMYSSIPGAMAKLKLLLENLFQLHIFKQLYLLIIIVEQ